MSVLASVRFAFSRVAEFFGDLRHSPLDPVPEIRKDLEAKGYRFEARTGVVLAAGHFGGMAMPIRQVIGANGDPVDYWGEDTPSRKYRRDYDEALARFKAAKAAGPSGPAPAP